MHSLNFRQALVYALFFFLFFFNFFLHKQCNNALCIFYHYLTKKLLLLALAILLTLLHYFPLSLSPSFFLITHNLLIQYILGFSFPQIFFRFLLPLCTTARPEQQTATEFLLRMSATFCHKCCCRRCWLLAALQFIVAWMLRCAAQVV